MSFFSLAPPYIVVSIVPVQIAERHLLLPDFHVFHGPAVSICQSIIGKFRSPVIWHLISDLYLFCS